MRPTSGTDAVGLDSNSINSSFTTGFLFTKGDNCRPYTYCATLSTLVLYNVKLSASMAPMPFKSLQGCLPDIADVLNANRTTLYERQRALVREGLLEALPGHGRGSGVRATPESIAMLTIGM